MDEINSMLNIYHTIKKDVLNKICKKRLYDIKS